MASQTHVAARVPLDRHKTLRFCIAAFCMDFGGGIFFVARPYLGMDLKAESWHLGVIGLIWGTTYAIATPLGGYIADRVNRKNQILASAILSAGLIFATTFVRTLPQLYLLQFLHALVFSFHWPAFFGWIGDAHFRSQLGRATAAFNVSWSLGGMLGCAVGGNLYKLGRILPFIWATGALLIAVVTIATLPWHTSRIKEPATSPRRHTPKRILMAVWISTFATFIVIGLLGLVFPKLGKDVMHIDADLFGRLASLQGAMRTLIFVAGIWFGRHLCSWRLTGAAQILVAVGVAGVAFTSSHAWIGLTMAIVGLSMGLNYYRGLYASLEGGSSSGLKSGIHEGMLFAGYVIGSAGGGALILLTKNLRAPYVPIGVALLGFLALQIFLTASARKRYGPWFAFSEDDPAPPPESGSEGS